MVSVAVGGVKVAYDVEGEGGGTPVVFVHGHPFDRTMWRPQMPARAGLGARTRIAPDLRGYGETAVVPGTTTLGRFARDVAAVLDAVGVERAVVCGLSMGGQIALEFRRLFGERVAGLVLADTFAQPDTPGGREDRYARADRLVREGMAGYAHEVLDSMVTPANVRGLPEVAAHVLRMMLGTDPQGAAAALRGRAERPDYTELLAATDVPVLVAVGREDVFTPVSDAEYMYERLPDARLAIVDGAGHLPNLERPEAFNRELAALLADVDAREAARTARPARI